MDERLADRLERALAEASAARGAELAQVAGNPLRIAERTFPHGLQARRVGTDLAYYRYFSGPFELRSHHASAITDLAHWYAEANAPCFVRLSPLLATEPLLRELAAAGLVQTGFMSLLYGPAGPLGDHDHDAHVTVQEVEHDRQRHAFLDLWTADAPEPERALRRRLARAEFAHWRCYLARLDGEPAAHAALFTSSSTRTGVLAATATLEPFRGRGCQSALIRWRLADAARAGCDLVVVEATPGSQSQRNLERLGLRLAYTRVIWSLEPVPVAARQ